MTINQKINYINSIEEKYPVWKWKINNIHIWPLIRFRIGDELWSDNKLNIGNSFKDKKRITRIVQLKNIIYLFVSILFSKKKTDILIFSRDVGKLSIGKKSYNFYTDPLYAKLVENNYLVKNIQRSKRIGNKDKNYVPSLLINYPLIQPLFALIKLFSKVTTNKSQLEEWDKFIEKNKYGLKYIDIDLEFRIKKELKNILAMKVFYTMLLRHFKPAIGIIHCFYAADSISIVLACKDLEIPIYDNQHGVQGNLHFAYSNWDHIQKVDYKMLPDGYLVWDENTKLNIDSWSKEKYASYIIGNLWQKEYKKFNNFHSDIDLLRIKVNGRKSVIYTLQRYKPPEWLIQIINEDQNIFWYIRAHPTHSGIGDSMQKELIGNNFDIEISSKIPLPALLEESDLHVTANSSVVIEASNFSIKSIVFDDIGKEYYNNYIEKGFVYSCLNKDSFITTLKKLLTQQVVNINKNTNNENDISNIFEKILSK